MNPCNCGAGEGAPHDPKCEGVRGYAGRTTSPARGVKCSMKDCDEYAYGYVTIRLRGEDPELVPHCQRHLKEMGLLVIGFGEQ